MHKPQFPNSAILGGFPAPRFLSRTPPRRLVRCVHSYPAKRDGPAPTAAAAAAAAAPTAPVAAAAAAAGTPPPKGAAVLRLAKRLSALRTLAGDRKLRPRARG